MLFSLFLPKALILLQVPPSFLLHSCSWFSYHIFVDRPFLSVLPCIKCPLDFLDHVTRLLASTVFLGDTVLQAGVRSDFAVRNCFGPHLSMRTAPPFVHTGDLNVLSSTAPPFPPHGFICPQNSLQAPTSNSAKVRVFDISLSYLCLWRTFHDPVGMMNFSLVGFFKVVFVFFSSVRLLTSMLATWPVASNLKDSLLFFREILFLSVCPVC